MRAEPMIEPGAALASVLARMILACLIASGSSSLKLVCLNNRAKERASGELAFPPSDDVWARLNIPLRVPAASALVITARRVMGVSLASPWRCLTAVVYNSPPHFVDSSSRRPIEMGGNEIALFLPCG